MLEWFTRYATLMPILLLLIMIYVGQIYPIFAHPVIVNSDPKQFQIIREPPDKVIIRFSEPIEIDYSKISVSDVNGKEVTIGKRFNNDQDKTTLVTKLQSNLSEGSYIVSSKVLSAVDGHVVDNSFTFNIGKETELSIKNLNSNRGILDILSLNDSLVRLPGYFGQILFFGVIFLNLWLWIPFSRMGSGTIAFVDSFRKNIENKLIRILIVSSILVLLSNVLMVVSQSQVLNTSVLNILMTKFGNIMIIRLLLVSILLTILTIIFTNNFKFKLEHINNSKIVFFFILIGLLLFFTNSLISHASATNNFVATGLDFFHQIAASIWIGGIIYLSIVIMPQIRKSNQGFERSLLTVLLIPRFSTAVVIIIGSISITGPMLLWSIENNLSFISSSMYGIILSIKITLAICMILLGGYHRFITENKIAATLGIGKNKPKKHNLDSNSQIRIFSNHLKIESAFGLALIFLVSLLTNMVLPASENISGIYHNDQEIYFKNPWGIDPEFLKSDNILSDLESKNLKLEGYSTTNADKKSELEIPGILGENRFKLYFVNETHKVDTNIINATIKITNLNENIGPIKITTKKIDAGIFSGNIPLNIPGMWNLEVQGITTRFNESNFIGIFKVDIKPKLNEFNFKINEFKTQNITLLLTPLFDKETNSIWIGDTNPNSGQIIQFKIDDKRYVSHKIKNTYLISMVKIDPKNPDNLWYLDPVRKNIGIYDIKLQKEIFQKRVPTNGTISGLAIDSQQNIWLTIIEDNSILKFDPKTEIYKAYKIPTKSSNPMNIIYDDLRDLLWFVEAEGKFGKIEPKNGSIIEYSTHRNESIELEEPSEIFIDQNGNEIFISDHKTNKIISFSPILEIFSQVYNLDNNGLAFGMTQDKYGNLWIAQHISDFIFILDPETKEMKKVSVPTKGSFVQHLTMDDKGRIWFAEQRGNGLGNIVITLNPTEQIQNTEDNILNQRKELDLKRENSLMNFLSFINLRFVEIIGIFIMLGMFISTVLFEKNQTDFVNEINLLRKMDGSYSDKISS